MMYNEKQINSLQKKLEATEAAYQQQVKELQENHAETLDELMRKLHNKQAECNHLRESLSAEQQLARHKRRAFRRTLGAAGVLGCIAAAIPLGMFAAAGSLPLWAPMAALLEALVIGSVTGWTH